MVVANDSCGNITTNAGISLSLFAIVSPSINTNNCTTSLVVGDAYCVTPLPPSENSTPITWNSFGCWSNADPSSAVLAGSNFTNGTGTTVEACADYCTQSDYAFFGLQNSDQCYCASEIGINSAQVAGSQCNLVCAGNSSETCCGSNTTSLFGIASSLFFQFSDLGCYLDSSTAHMLSGASLLRQSNNTVEACAAFCLPTYSLFGVENGNDC